jgi:hypothetical protein
MSLKAIERDAERVRDALRVLAETSEMGGGFFLVHCMPLDGGIVTFSTCVGALPPWERMMNIVTLYVNSYASEYG